MLFRPYLAAVGCAAAVVLGAAVPAVAASGPSTTAPVPAPTRDSQPLVVKCPPAAAGVAQADKVAVAKAKDVKRSGTSEAALCRQLADQKLGVPKGAPETGGGGMAAEVGSWG